MSTKVWLAQMKCPDGHCILAASQEAESRAQAEAQVAVQLRQAIDYALRSCLNPWCGICGARAETWKIDLQETAFTTMAEAMPSLLEAQEANRRALALYGDLHRKQRPN